MATKEVVQQQLMRRNERNDRKYDIQIRPIHAPTKQAITVSDTYKLLFHYFNQPLEQALNNLDDFCILTPLLSSLTSF